MNVAPVDMKSSLNSPIGVFDSGYGGLTILKQFVTQMPQYDFIYLGDNARAPYGSRSFPVVYEYTLEAVKSLFQMGCPLIILACNTSSAKALRTIQQKDLPRLDSTRRVLGIIRPTVEEAGRFTHTNHIGILGTLGTVNSQSYILEIKKLYPQMVVNQEACPLWVPLVENYEYHNEGAEYFIRRNIENLLSKDPLIDTILLGCTHYPLLWETIKKYVPAEISIVAQDQIVAQSLGDYLQRHPEMDVRISKNFLRLFFTTETAEVFEERAGRFFGSSVKAEHIPLLPA